MKLSRIIPSRRKTVELKWLRREFTTMSEHYRQIRSRTHKPMDACFWCGHEFEDGENMGLACVEGVGNKVVCNRCTDEVGKDNGNG